MVDLDEIKGQVSVPAALEQLGLDPPSRIPGHILSPVRDETQPSMWIAEDRWWDFGAGEGGDVIDLVRYITGASFKAAAMFLSGGVLEGGEHTVTRTPEREVIDLTERWLDAREPTPADWVWAEKWIDSYTPALDRTHLRMLDRTRVLKVSHYNIWIPHRYEGQVVGIKLRRLDGQLGAKTSLKGSTFTLGLYTTGDVDLTVPAVLVEGETDCWAATSHYDTAAQVYALPSGGSTIKPVFIDELARHPSVHLMLDNDDVGRKAADRIGRELFHERGYGRLTLHHLPVDLDFCDAIKAGYVPPEVA